MFTIEERKSLEVVARLLDTLKGEYNDDLENAILDIDYLDIADTYETVITLLAI